MTFLTCLSESLFSWQSFIALLHVRELSSKLCPILKMSPWKSCYTSNKSWSTASARLSAYAHGLQTHRQTLLTVQPWERTQTDGWTDRRYQFYYLLRFAFDSNTWWLLGYFDCSLYMYRRLKGIHTHPNVLNVLGMQMRSYLHISVSGFKCNFLNLKGYFKLLISLICLLISHVVCGTWLLCIYK